MNWKCWFKHSWHVVESCGGKIKDHATGEASNVLAVIISYKRCGTEKGRLSTLTGSTTTVHPDLIRSIMKL